MRGSEVCKCKIHEHSHHAEIVKCFGFVKGVKTERRRWCEGEKGMERVEEGS